MSILSILGFGGEGMGRAAEGVASVIDAFKGGSAEEKAAAETLKQRILQKPDLAQVELNRVEARHRSVFVAGWRPFAGWGCGVALWWHFLLYDLFYWFTSLFAFLPPPPELRGAEDLMYLLGGMLGFAGARSWEKSKGLTR